MSDKKTSTKGELAKEEAAANDLEVDESSDEVVSRERSAELDAGAERRSLRGGPPSGRSGVPAAAASTTALDREATPRRAAAASSTEGPN